MPTARERYDAKYAARGKTARERWDERYGGQRPPSRTQSGKDVFGQAFKESISLGYARGDISPSAAEEHPVAQFSGSLVGGLPPVIGALATPIPGDELLAATTVGRMALNIGKGGALGFSRATGKPFLSPEDLTRRGKNAGQEGAAFLVFEAAPPAVRQLLPGLAAKPIRRTLAESTGIGGGMYGLGLAEGQPPDEALLEAATMATMHGITAPFRGGRKVPRQDDVKPITDEFRTPSGEVLLQDIVAAADERNLRRKLQHPSRQLPAPLNLLTGRTEGEIIRSGARQPFIRRDASGRVIELEGKTPREYGQYSERDLGGREEAPYGQYAEDVEVSRLPVRERLGQIKPEAIAPIAKPVERLRLLPPAETKPRVKESLSAREPIAEKRVDPKPEPGVKPAEQIETSIPSGTDLGDFKFRQLQSEKEKAYKAWAKADQMIRESKAGSQLKSIYGNPTGEAQARLDKLREIYEQKKQTLESVKEARKAMRTPPMESVEQKPVAPEAKAEEKSAEVLEVPIDNIRTDVDRFQNRLTDFSVKTAKRIEDSYDENLFDPIVLWKDPNTGESFVLSGHSRLEGVRRRGHRTVKSRFFKGTEEQAIEFARIEANRTATPETIAETVGAYELAREKKYTKTKMKEIFDGDIELLESISHLNKKGQWLQHLENPVEFPYIKRFARWVGDARKRYPDKITDRHETELFDFFYRSKEGNRNILRDDFFARIDKQVEDVFFDNESPLNLESAKLTTGARARSDMSEGIRKIDKLNEEIKSIRVDKDIKGTEEARLVQEKLRHIEDIKRQLKDTESQEAMFGGIPIPDRATFKAMIEVDRELIRHIAREAKTRIEAYKELPAQIQAKLKAAAVYPKQFWEATVKLADGIATGLRESVEQIVRQAVKWLKDNLKLDRYRAGSLSTKKIGRKSYSRISAPSQRRLGRTSKRLEFSDKDVNEMARKKIGAKRGASELDAKKAKELNREMNNQYKRGKGIGIDSQAHRELRDMMRERNVISDSRRKRILAKFGVKRLRDIPESEVENLKTYLQNYAEPPDYASIAKKGGQELYSKARDMWGQPMIRLSETKQGRWIVEQLFSSKAKEAMLHKKLKVVEFEDVYLDNAPKMYELEYATWMRNNWKGYVESFGKKNLPPEQFRARAEAIRKEWKRISDDIADYAESIGVKGFKRIREEGYFMDMLTSDAKNAIFAGERDPVYEAIRKVSLVKERGLEYDLGELRADIVSEHTYGSFENPRIANLPETVVVNGKTIRILSSDPNLMLSHLRRGMKRLALIEQFGQGDLTAKLSGAIEGHARERRFKHGEAFNTKNEMDWATEVVNTFQGYEGQSIPKVLQPIQSLIRTGQLTLAAIPNAILGQVPVVTKYGLKNAASNLFEAMRGSTRLEKARSYNAWARDSLFQNMDIADLQGWSGKLSRKALDLVWFNGANRLINRFSSLQALEYFSEAARKGDRAKLQDLYKDYGFSEKQIEDIIARKGLSEVDEAQVFSTVSAITNVTNETSLLRQPWMNKPLAASLLTYTSFIRRYGEIGVDAIMKAQEGNVQPLAVFVFGNLAGAEAVTWLRNWLKGKEREDETIYMRLFNDLLYSGALGITGEIAERVYFGAKYHESLQESVGGAPISGLNSIYENLIQPPLRGEKPKVQKALRRGIAAYPVLENVARQVQ